MSKEKIVHSIIRSGLGAIPLGGQAAVELFESVVTDPIVKRRNAWEENIGARLAALESEEKINLSQLCNDDTFINILLHASQIAIRNNQKNRLEALENAVINSALPDAPEEVLQQIYLNLIETLSTLHVYMLNRFGGIILNVKDPKEILKKEFPEMEKEENLYMHIWQDLIAKNLIRMETNDSFGYTISRTSLGHGFIDFVTQKDLSNKNK